MNKTNVFCSTEFTMEAGDVLHLLLLDEVGDTVTIELSNPDVNELPGPPTATDASDRTDTGLTANWMWNEDTMGYYLDVATDIDFTTYVSGYEDLDVGLTNYYDVTGLDPGTSYYYRLRAYNDYGISTYSNVIETSTPINSIYGALYNWYAVNKTITTNAYADVYGALYNWHAVNYSTGGASIAPAGWHVPTLTEWNTLIATAGGSGLAGGALKEVGSVHWTLPNTGAVNAYGFTALPGGYRRNIPVSFDNIYDYAVFWTATQYDATYAYFINMFYNNDNVTVSQDNKPAGRSVRLVKDDSINTGTMTDYDGNVYNTVTIGTQVWMASNLKVRHYNDGTAIPNVTLKATWDALTTGALCFYDNEADVVNSVFAPTGWHVPTSAEFTTLIATIDPGGTNFINVAGKELKESGAIHWLSPNTGTNSLGFNGVGSGVRGAGGGYSGINTACFLWTTDDFFTSKAIFQLTYSNDSLALAGNSINSGESVRLIKNDSIDPLTMTDYDGNVYDTVTIGGQVWMAQNLRVTHYNDGTPIPMIIDNIAWGGDTDGAMCWYDNIAP